MPSWRRASDEISRPRVLCELERVHVPHVDDPGADLDSLGSGSDRGQQRERRGELPSEVVDPEVRTIRPELLGSDGEVDALEERIGGGADVGGRVVGPMSEREKADLHTAVNAGPTQGIPLPPKGCPVYPPRRTYHLLDRV